MLTASAKRLKNMSALSDKRDTALANIRQRLTTINQMLASSGNDSDIEAFPVVVQYKIGVRQKSGSQLSEAEFSALLESLSFTDIEVP